MQNQISQSNFEQKLKEEQAQTFDDFWSSVEVKVRTDLRDVLQQNLGSLYSPEELEERFEVCIGREKEFARVMFEAVSEVARNNPRGFNALFDIDETVGAFKYITEKQTKTILRPSAAVIFEHIQKQAGAIGFLTSRSKEAVFNQLKDEAHLKPIARHITPELVYSSEDVAEGSSSDTPRFIKNLESDFGGEKGLVDMEAVKADPYFESVFGSGGDMAKLNYLKEISPKLKGIPTLVVDDSRYPKYLNKKQGWYGVALDRNSMFYL